MPTWDAPEINQEEITNYIKDLNDWRKGNAKESLQFGKMVKPLEFACNDYIEGIIKGGVHHYKTVESCAYQTQNGIYQQIFTNFTATTQTIELSLEKDVKLFKNATSSEYVSLSKGTVKIDILPRSTVMISVE